MDPIFVIGALSALLGTLLPLVKEFVKALRKTSRGEKFFNSSPGQAVLRALELHQRPDSPATLFAELGETSRRMDSIVSRIQEYTRAREIAVTRLEDQLSTLTDQEAELRKRIEGLQRVPLPAAEHFASLVNKGERSSAARDYILFVAGVIVSALVAVVLRQFGLA